MRNSRLLRAVTLVGLALLAIVWFVVSGEAIQLTHRLQLRGMVGSDEALEQYLPPNLASQLEAQSGDAASGLQDLNSIEDLRAVFDEDAGVPRLVLLLSPT